MQLNSKSSIPITWGAAILITAVQATVTYMASSYGTKSAIKELEYKMSLEISNLKNDNVRIWDNIASLKESDKKTEIIFEKIGSALIPEKPDWRRRK